ncbi:MAG TPA: FeoB small GTPase domain-containing protein, partial [Bacteroidales bacterium]|nr:FeoB small GTPase domain-containing protein [Bacteroidales bacterium]
LSEVHTGDTLIVARLSGRWGIRRKLMAAGLNHGVHIKIKSADSEFLHYQVNGNKRKRKLLLSITPFVTVVSASDPDYQQKIDALCNVIPAFSFGDPDVLKDIFGCDFQAFGHCKLPYHDHEIHLTHLPDVQTISGSGENETAIRKLITGQYPDLIVGVIDAARLEEDLYLASFYIDMDVKMMLIVKGLDSLAERGLRLDYEHLGKMLGTPLIAYKGNEDRDHILKTLLNIHHNTEPWVRHIHINYGVEPERTLNRLAKHIIHDIGVHEEVAPRFTALRLLERDEFVKEKVSFCNRCDRRKCLTEKEIHRLEGLFDSSVHDIMHEARMSFIKGGIKENISVISASKAKETQRKIDAVLAHKRWGIPIFFAFIFITFYATFELGKYPSGWLETGVLYLTDLFQRVMTDGAAKSLVIDGVLGGVGGILVYIPNIFILFFFIGLLETTGYLSRGAFLVDKYMHRIGLHGKSFIPLIMGFGCTVPAVMATRMLDDRRSRLMTMLIVPFMS